MASPKLSIAELSASQSQKEVTVNTGVIRAVDALVQATVKDKDLATPPGSPADGDTYIVAGSPTGAWVGHATHIAYYQSSAWAFHTPAEGWLVYMQDENLFYVFNGSAWVDMATGGGISFLFLIDTPDSYSGQALKLARVNTGETALEFVEIAYDVPVYVSTKPQAGEVIARIKMVRAVTFASSLTGSQGIAGTSATAEAIFSIKKNGTEFGTATFAISGTVPTFASASGASFAAGDILTIEAPGSQDATLASVNLTLLGKRG